MGFFKTLITGYKLLYRDVTTKHSDLIPKCFSGCGTGLMMIGSAITAKTAMKDDVKGLIEQCEADIQNAMQSVEGEKKIERTKRVLKAKATKGLKIVKIFHKGIICEVAGAGMNAIGFGMEVHGKHRALKAAGAVGAAFASYRAAVREDLGEEADLRYFTGRNAVKKTQKIDRRTGEVTEELEYIQDDDGFTIKKDPNAFRFRFSEETCPSIWCPNFDLRKSKLKNIQNNLTLQLHVNGFVTLNTMREEFGGYNPKEMDVGIGGIFGRALDPNKPVHQQHINLHFEDDKDFMEGRTDECWIIFECDPEPIIDRINCKRK